MSATRKKKIRKKKIKVLYADSPWKYRDSLPGPKRGARKHYKTMTVDKIARFPLPDLAKNAWLFLWRVHTHQEEAKFVMQAWGFKYAGEVVWVKTTKDGTKPRRGMGHSVRNAHEICLIGRRGRPARKSKAIGSVIHAPLGRHSEKPEEMYRLIEAFAHGPYCELFARNTRRRWASYGNELKKAHP